MKWLTIEGLKEEIRKIRWPKKADMIKDTQTVLSFIAIFAFYFVICEFVVSAFLKIIGIGA